MMRSDQQEEKLAAILRRHGGYTGKKQATYRTLKYAFDDINKRQNKIHW